MIEVAMGKELFERWYVSNKFIVYRKFKVEVNSKKVLVFDHLVNIFAYQRAHCLASLVRKTEQEKGDPALQSTLIHEPTDCR